MICQMCTDKEVEIASLRSRLALAEKVLQSIANNSCCDGCQEAAKVARAALKPADAPKEG